MSHHPHESSFKKHFCTVTLFTKILAMAIFVLLPVITFYIGLYYGMALKP